MQKSQVALLKIKLMNNEASEYVEQEENTEMRKSIIGRRGADVGTSDYE